MWWLKDDLADRLIAHNAARPRPGMEKPDMRKLAGDGWERRRRERTVESAGSFVEDDVLGPQDAVRPTRRVRA